MKTLYWFMGIPERLELLLPYPTEGDTLLLSAASVFAALGEGELFIETGVKTLVLDIDLQTRGLNGVDLKKGVEVISFSDLILLIHSHSKVVTWS